MAGIGKMRHTIQFIDITSAQDTDGVWNEVQTVLATDHAAVRQRGGNNFSEVEGQAGFDNEIDFEVRYPVNFPLNTNTFILYNNRTYKIVNILVKEGKLFKYVITGISRDPATIEQ